MEPETQTKTPILQVAWNRYAQMDASAEARSHPHLRLRWWIAALGVLTTLFVILTALYPKDFSPVGGLILKYLLVATPIIGSLLAALTSKLFGTGDWLITRAGAEEILKEIYTYRTILAGKPDRRDWLETRLAEIQRQVFRGLGGELIYKKYEGPLPPYYDNNNPDSDPGMNDLSGEEYFKYRLMDQLKWHQGRLQGLQGARTRLIVLIVAAGAVGAMLAAAELTLWVALAASFGAAFVGWQELRNYDQVIKNYSKVILELTILHDGWRALEVEERTEGKFFQLVQATEGILWSQNADYIKSMQEALANASLDEQASLVTNTIKQAVESDARFRQSMRDSFNEMTGEQFARAEGVLGDTFKTTLNTLAEEASSEIVQKELAAMRQAIGQGIKPLKASIQEISAEFRDVELTKETPNTVLNEVIARYPKTGEIKG